ncbi:hypothetical protein BJ742DRAFT_244793 [Cladochytrium replicatum]|nr:hypothetical protein BJ742DRAFT_244793 [Cladochytrium replicatum]
MLWWHQRGRQIWQLRHFHSTIRHPPSRCVPQQDDPPGKAFRGLLFVFHLVGIAAGLRPVLFLHQRKMHSEASADATVHGGSDAVDLETNASEHKSSDPCEKVAAASNTPFKKLLEHHAIAKTYDSPSSSYNATFPRVNSKDLFESDDLREAGCSNQTPILSPSDCRAKTDHLMNDLRSAVHNTNTAIAKSIFEEIDKLDVLSVEHVTMVYESMLILFGKTGNVDDAITLYERTIVKGLPATRKMFHSLMLARMRSGSIVMSAIEGAFSQMEQEGISPNLQSFTILARAYLKTGRTEGVRRCYERLVLTGIQPDEKFHCIILQSHVLDGNYDLALSSLERIAATGGTVNVAMYSVVIHGYAQAKKMDDATSLLLTMETRAVKPDCAVFTILCEGFANQNEFDRLDELEAEMKYRGIQRTPEHYSMLIHVYAKMGNIGRALSILDEMASTVGVTKTALDGYLSGVGKSGCASVEKHIETLVQKGYQIKTSWTSNVQIMDARRRNGREGANSKFHSLHEAGSELTDHNLAAVLSANRGVGPLQQENMLFWAAKHGIRPDKASFNELVFSYATSGDLASAFRILVTMRKHWGVEPTEETYQHLLRACLESNGSTARFAKMIFQEMESAGFRPSKRHFHLMLNVLGKAGDVKSVIYILEKMKHYGVDVDVLHMKALVSCFASIGDVEKIETLLASMSAGSPSQNLLESISSYFILGNVSSGRLDEALMAVRTAFEQWQEYPRPHIINRLADALNAQGRFQDFIEFFEAFFDETKFAAKIDPEIRMRTLSAYFCALVGNCHELTNERILQVYTKMDTLGVPRSIEFYSRVLVKIARALQSQKIRGTNASINMPVHISLISDMVADILQSDPTILDMKIINSVARCFSLIGDVDSMGNLHWKVRDELNILPDTEFFVHYAYACSTAGKPESLMEVWRMHVLPLLNGFRGGTTRVDERLRTPTMVSLTSSPHEHSDDSSVAHDQFSNPFVSFDSNSLRMDKRGSYHMTKSRVLLFLKAMNLTGRNEYVREMMRDLAGTDPFFLEEIERDPSFLLFKEQVQKGRGKSKRKYWD